MIKTLTTFLIYLISTTVYAQSEDYHLNKWCKARSDFITTERRVKAGYVDCLLTDYAIEFGFAHKWKEDIAQARWYALQTGKKAGMVMILKKPTDTKYFEYVMEYLQFYNGDSQPIKIWTVNDYE